MERGAVRRVLLALWVLGLGSVGSRAGPVEDYQVRMETVSFDKAVEGCSGGGRLAELSTQQELHAVLRGLEARLEGSDPRTFWVGLRRPVEKCVMSDLPLRGYVWQSDGGENWNWPHHWWDEPLVTCTLSRCVALKVQTNGTALTRWGLQALSCKDSLAFVCKRTHGPPEAVLPISSTGGTEPPTTHTLAPTTLPSTTLAPTTLTPSPLTAAGPQIEPAKGPATRLCPNPPIPRSRWLAADHADPLVLVVACWSGVQWKLTCSGERWLMDGSDLDPDTVCPETPSETPTETPPETPPPPPPRLEPWAGILMGVVAAVVVLVVLLVVVVRCCLVRRSKDRAVRKAEKMAMKNKEAGRLHGDGQ